MAPTPSDVGGIGRCRDRQPVDQQRAGNGTVISTTTINAATSNNLGSLSFTSLDGADTVTLARLTVTLTTSIATGDGVDTVRIDDSTLTGAVIINTGGAGDQVQIESSSNNSVSTTFKAAVSINTGSGNDTLQIGEDADDRAIFQVAPITFDGGLGFDRGRGAALQQLPARPTDHQQLRDCDMMTNGDELA